MPPLRDAPGDILLLAQLLPDADRGAHEQAACAASRRPAARLLLDYDWPGNVRELENCMERAVALCRLDEITVDDLPAKLVEHADRESVVMTALSPDELITLDEMEQRYVRQVLALSNGNKTHAASILGIDRRSLYRRLTGADSEASRTSAREVIRPARARAADRRR